MQTKELKIGLFDSGLGGLTVVKALTEVIKGAKIFYIADTKHAPYGEKTTAQILQYALSITHYLVRVHDIDALIIACNTATSAAIKELREAYPDLVIIGTEPGIKPAMRCTKTGKIGVLATPATLNGKKYQELVATLSQENDVHIFEQACPGLVEQIENGESTSTKTLSMLREWLLPMRVSNVDTIVLGCTHYPLVAQTIVEMMQCDLQLIETGKAIAQRLYDLSTQKGHQNEGSLEISIYATDTIREHLVRAILDMDVDIEKIEIEDK